MARRRLAAAGFAHQTHGLAALDFKADAIYRTDITHGFFEKAGLDGEPFDQVLYLEEVFAVLGLGVFDLSHITVPPHSQISDT